MKFRPRVCVVLLLLASLVQIGSAQEPAVPPQDQAAQPTFKAGINFVRVDVIVTDRKDTPVTNLTKDDFEVIEDGKVQPIEQFRLIKVDGAAKPGDPPPRQIRNRDDEQQEAGRDDVRVYAFLLDDYHVRRSTSMTVRNPIVQFIQTQLRPNDLVAVMYPLTPIGDLLFTNDHASIVSAIERFEGRKYDYTPRNIYEQNYARLSPQDIERIRNDIVMGALKALSIRLGSLREGRKSIILVSEGFTALLPPQMNRADASRPVDPRQTAVAAGAQDSDRQRTAEWFQQSEVMMRLREVYQDANRHNTSIYSLDPRGLTPFEFQIDDVPFASPPSFATDARVLQMSQDTLRVLAEETDGRAIVNRNSLAQGLAQIVRDSSFYYLLGYNSTQAQNDGKFHEIKVRVKRPNVDVRARKGYWALTAADVSKVTNPTPDVARPVSQALATLATSAVAGKYVRTWVGTQQGENGRTRVTVIWEPLPQVPGARREQPGRVSLLAADAAGDLIFRGSSPDTAVASATAARPVPAAAAATTPQRIVFDAAPGKVELRMTVQEAGTGGTLDQEIRSIDVPDLTAPQAAISTPRVFRGRTPRELQTAAADPNAIPVASREFSRTERLLIRFDVYAAGTEAPEPTAALLNRAGQKMSDVPITPAQAGGTHQINLGLGTVPAGEYLVEITVKGASGEAKELVPLRVTS
jgi:VWFA-related protein